MSVQKVIDSQVTQTQPSSQTRSTQEQAIPTSVLERGRAEAGAFFSQQVQEKSYTEQNVEGMAEKILNLLEKINYSALTEARENHSSVAYAFLDLQSVAKYLNYIRNAYVEVEHNTNITFEKLDVHLGPCLKHLIARGREIGESKDLQPKEALASLEEFFNCLPENGPVVFTFLMSVCERAYS